MAGRQQAPGIRGLSAVTLATHDMGVALSFYQTLGLRLVFGGATADFSSLQAGSSHVNLVAAADAVRWSWWGRFILHVDDVDAVHQRLTAAGWRPDAPPQDASWGERYFHITDPDGHELSIARPLAAPPSAPA